MPSHSLPLSLLFLNLFLALSVSLFFSYDEAPLQDYIPLFIPASRIARERESKSEQREACNETERDKMQGRF